MYLRIKAEAESQVTEATALLTSMKIDHSILSIYGKALVLTQFTCLRCTVVCFVGMKIPAPTVS